MENETIADVPMGVATCPRVPVAVSIVLADSSCVGCAGFLAVAVVESTIQSRGQSRFKIWCYLLSLLGVG